MYSNLKSVQMLIALLKKYGVKHVVMSPGGSDIPIIHSIENDSDFVCYSVVDERSAVYFGMGVAQQTNSPVACVCTSGTAVSNYLPGMTEASFQNVPIVAITADKNPRYLGQLEIQKTNQINIFGDVCRKAVELPIIQSTEDEWYCERLIAETLVELTHKGTGPVHINIPIVENNAIYDVETLPDVKDIQIIPAYATQDEWARVQKELANAKRIMIVVGQNVHYSKELIKNIEMFYKHYNCMISVESLSNLDCDGTIHTYPITEMKKGNLTQNLVPDLVISIGNNIASYGLKPFLRNHRKEFKHWAVDSEGRIRDVFNGLRKVFECPELIFFSKMNELAKDTTHNDGLYFNTWKELYDKIVIPEFEFSNFYVAQQLSKVIPENSILHTAILNSTRVMQFFELAKGVKCYSNIGALGIDGCMSTFMGQAACTSELAFLLIGDLSFFYDMNSAGIKHVGNNVRVIMLNNGGGSEFHFMMGRKKIPTINDHICAEHHKIAEGWVTSLGYKYYSASTKEELDAILPKFVEKSDAPMFIEVMTDMEEEAERTKKFYIMNDNDTVQAGLKNAAKAVLSDSQIDTLKKVKGKLFGR